MQQHSVFTNSGGNDPSMRVRVSWNFSGAGSAEPLTGRGGAKWKYRPDR